MSRLLVDDVTKTDRRALLNVNKMATISDIVAPTREYLRASGADELTVESGCVIAVGGAGIFKTAETKLTAANLDTGATFAVGNDYYVYICDSRVDAQDEQYIISLNSTYPSGWNASNSRKIGGFHYGRCRKVNSNLQPVNSSGALFGTGWESAVTERKGSKVVGKWWRNRDRIRVSGNEALVVELERIRDEDDRQNKRIAVIEEDTKAIHKLTASIEKLVIQMQDMLSEQKEQGERIRRLEEEPGNAWNEVKKKAIDTVVGLVAGALATGLIYMIAQNM